MEARSSRQIRDKFKDLYLTALVANWKVWPAAQVSSSIIFSFCGCWGLKHSISVHQFPVYTSSLPCPVLTSLRSFLDIVFVHSKLWVSFLFSYFCDIQSHSLYYLGKTRSRTKRARHAKHSAHRLSLFFWHLHVCILWASKSPFFWITVFLMVNANCSFLLQHIM